MIEININQRELESIDLFRGALSEETSEQRLIAIRNIKHDVIARKLEDAKTIYGKNCFSGPENAELAEWIIVTSSDRHEAGIALAQLAERYDKKMLED